MLTQPDTLTPRLWLLAQDAAEAGGKSLLDHIASGGVIGFIILLLSFVGLLLFIAHLVQIRESRLAPADVASRLRDLLKAGDVRGAIQFCQAEENDCFLTRVFGAALIRCSRSPFGLLELKSALEETGQEQVARLYRATDGIGLIAAVAPMLGLLGTVVGMVGAFDVISQTGGTARYDQLAGDISQALITTVLGLIVAIPATMVFTYLRNRIDNTAAHVAELIEDLAWRLEGGSQSRAPSQQRQPASPRPTPQPSPAHSRADTGAPGSS